MEAYSFGFVLSVIKMSSNRNHINHIEIESNKNGIILRRFKLKLTKIIVKIILVLNV